MIDDDDDDDDDDDLMCHIDQMSRIDRIHDIVHGSLVLVRTCRYHHIHSHHILQTLQTKLQTHLVLTYVHVLHDDDGIVVHMPLVDTVPVPVHVLVDTVPVLVHVLVDNIVRTLVLFFDVLVRKLDGIVHMLVLVDIDPVRSNLHYLCDNDCLVLYFHQYDHHLLSTGDIVCALHRILRVDLYPLIFHRQSQSPETNVHSAPSLRDFPCTCQDGELWPSYEMLS